MGNKLDEKNLYRDFSLHNNCNNPRNYKSRKTPCLGDNSGPCLYPLDSFFRPTTLLVAKETKKVASLALASEKE